MTNMIIISNWRLLIKFRVDCLRQMSFFFFDCPRTIDNIVNIYWQIAFLIRTIDRNIDDIIDRLRAQLENKPIELLYRSGIKSLLEWETNRWYAVSKSVRQLPAPDWLWCFGPMWRNSQICLCQFLSRPRYALKSPTKTETQFWPNRYSIPNFVILIQSLNITSVLTTIAYYFYSIRVMIDK